MRLAQRGLAKRERWPSGEKFGTERGEIKFEKR